MKKFIITFLTTAFVLLGGAVLAPASTYAEGETADQAAPSTAIQVSPTHAIVTLQGGDVLSGNAAKCPKDLDAGCAIEVKNVGTEPFRYKVYASPYSVSGEDYNVDFSKSTQYTQIARWISFLDADGSYQESVIREVAPGETQTIEYRIDVPEDVPGGAQYAVIWAQTLSNGASTGTSVQTLSQAGMVVSGRSIGDTRQTAEVTDYDFTRFSVGGTLSAKATIKNTGNTDFDAYYYYTAKTLFGKELYSKNDSIATYPDTEYHVNVDWENTPMLGIFQVEFKISAADTVKTETHIVIIMPVFIMILLILLLTVIIVWIIIIIRKRKERKARTLV